MILNKKELLENGYLTFNLKDLDETLYNRFLEKFNKNLLRKQIKFFRNDSTLFKKHIPTDLNNFIKDKFLTDANGDINDRGLIKDKPFVDLKYKFEGTFENLKKIDNYLNELIEIEPLNQTGQTWYFGDLEWNGIDGKLTPSAQLVESLYIQTIKNLYRDDIINKDDYEPYKIINQETSIVRGTDVTLYLKNNYINAHQDSEGDFNRLCVMLIYLNEDWENGYGGEIVVDEELVIPPSFGNVVILDFTQNNISHEVLKIVNEDFERFALIKFFYK